MEFPQVLANSIELVEEMYKEESRICIKTHLPWDLLPKQIQNSEKKPKVPVLDPLLWEKHTLILIFLGYTRGY